MDPFQLKRPDFKLDPETPPLGSAPRDWERTITDEWYAAERYIASASLTLAIQLAVRLSRPLLLTGRPGSGKTTAAYWAALHMGLRPWNGGVEHVQIKSTAKAGDLIYEFDAVAYLREGQERGFASLGQQQPKEPESAEDRLEMRRRHLHEGPFWKAFTAKRAFVLLLDEMDKAPRDVPNDLLRELDRGYFDVPELGGEKVARGKDDFAFLCVLTSNEERQFPDAFLRRCLHHRVEHTSEQMKEIARAHVGKLYRDMADRLPKNLLEIAADHVDDLGKQKLEVRPGLADLLVWLRAVGELAVEAKSGDRVSEDRIREIATMALLKTTADVQNASASSFSLSRSSASSKTKE